MLNGGSLSIDVTLPNGGVDAVGGGKSRNYPITHMLNNLSTFDAEMMGKLQEAEDEDEDEDKELEL